MQLALHFACDLQLSLQALAFFLTLKEPLQVLRHAVKRIAELGELIVPLDVDQVSEIAAHDALCSFVQVVHGRSDGAGQRDADDHGDKLHDQECESEQVEVAQQILLVALRLVTEQNLQNAGYPRPHSEDRPAFLRRCVPQAHRHPHAPENLEIKLVLSRRLGIARVRGALRLLVRNRRMQMHRRRIAGIVGLSEPAQRYVAEAWHQTVQEGARHRDRNHHIAAIRAGVRPEVEESALHDNAAHIAKTCRRRGQGGVVGEMHVPVVRVVNQNLHPGESVMEDETRPPDGLDSRLRRHLGKRLRHGAQRSDATLHLRVQQKRPNLACQRPGGQFGQDQNQNQWQDGNEQVGDDKPVPQAPDQDPDAIAHPTHGYRKAEREDSRQCDKARGGPQPAPLRKAVDNQRHAQQDFEQSSARNRCGLFGRCLHYRFRLLNPRSRYIRGIQDGLW